MSVSLLTAVSMQDVSTQMAALSVDLAFQDLLSMILQPAVSQPVYLGEVGY